MALVMKIKDEKKRRLCCFGFWFLGFGFWFLVFLLYLILGLSFILLFFTKVSMRIFDKKMVNTKKKSLFKLHYKNYYTVILLPTYALLDTTFLMVFFTTFLGFSSSSSSSGTVVSVTATTGSGTGAGVGAGAWTGTGAGVGTGVGGTTI